MKSFKNPKGFTLLELMIVVVILAILAGLALPQYFRTIGRARESEGWQVLGSIRSALSRYYAEYNSLSGVTTAVLDIDIPTTTMFTYTFPGAGPDYTFTATATPTATCGSCRTLTIDQDGTRTST